MTPTCGNCAWHILYRGKRKCSGKAGMCGNITGEVALECTNTGDSCRDWSEQIPDPIPTPKWEGPPPSKEDVLALLKNRRPKK